MNGRDRERALVTGASAGIGAEIARLLAEEGVNLVLTARRRDRLEALAEQLRAAHRVDVDVIAVDLGTTDGPGGLADEVRDRELPIDILVNNAGFGARGAFLDIPLDRQLEMIRLNVMALIELTGRLAPAMRSRGRGGVLNVGSLAGFQPGPHMAIYYATKAMVLSFSEALHTELKGTGVHVSCLCPGPTETEFTEVAGMRGSRLFKAGTMTAEAVARAGLRGLRRNQAVVIPGVRQKIVPQLERLMPRAMVRWLSSKVQ